MNVSILFASAWTPALASLGASGWCLAASLAVLAVAAWLFAASRRRRAPEAEPEPAVTAGDEAEEAQLDHLLKNSSRARSTLMKLATYQDAEMLRDIAVRETGEMLGASAALLFRHAPDGTSPLCDSWFADKSRGGIPADVAQDSESPDYLDSHVFIGYRRGQRKDNNPKWDALLSRVGADIFLAGSLKVDGETWGHVSYVLKRGADLTPGEIEQFHEACAMVQIGVARAGVLEKREEHRRQLAAAARAANRAAKAKTLFLATMSHEIRTPLNAIVGFSEFLNDPAVTKDETKEYTAGIAQSASALLALVNDVLDLSKLESGKIDMSGRCELAQLFGELASVFRYRARAKSVEISTHISPDFPALKLSEDHLRQILLNLVGNAVKFTENGSVELSAEYRPDGDGTVALHIYVRDTGCGIPPEKLRNIFDPFAEDGGTRGGKAYAGTGLGLPIVKRMIDSCNGTISIDSAPGKGTEVYVRIGHVEVDSGAEAKPAKKIEAKLPDDFSVLIVDDVPVNLKVLSLRVKKMGITSVTTAASGEEAMKILEGTRPSVVLTDMWMPGMNGAELAAAMRQSAKCADVPVIAVTADSDAKASFDMSNFSGMLTKPVSVEKLKASLAAVAGGKRAA